MIARLIQKADKYTAMDKREIRSSGLGPINHPDICCLGSEPRADLYGSALFLIKVSFDAFECSSTSAKARYLLDILDCEGNNQIVWPHRQTIKYVI